MEERKRIHQLAVVPPLCLDNKQRRYKFINNNGFISDPVALFRAAKNEVYWTEKEKEIFLEKMLNFGKNFEIIASYLDKKRVQDCIEYYYSTKKKVNYKMLIRKHQRKRKKNVPINQPANNNNNNNGNGPAGSNGSSGNNNLSSNNNGSFGTNNNNNNNNNSSGNNNSSSCSSSNLPVNNLNTCINIPVLEPENGKLFFSRNIIL